MKSSMWHLPYPKTCPCIHKILYTNIVITYIKEVINETSEPSIHYKKSDIADIKT